MPRPKRETKQFSGQFNQGVWDKLQEIKEELGVGYDITAIEACIQAAYSGNRIMKPAYEKAMESRTPRENDPTKRAQKYVDEKEAKDKLLKEQNTKKGMEISEILDGKVVDHGNGFYSVEYKIYDLSTPHYVNVGKLTVPFEQLDEHNITNQYKASVPFEGDLKEVVKKVLAEQE